MEMKKISFGFSKSARKPALQAGPSAIGVREKDDGKDKIELISCVEEQSIKVVGKENGGDDGKPTDLVIPLREQDKTTIPGRLAKLQGIKEGQTAGVVVSAEKKEETLEQKAAREIMEDLKERQENFGKQDNFVVPLKPEDLPLEGAQESTLDDYEAIPIESFGMAMLRGMGFKEDTSAAAAKKKEKDDKLLPDGPVMRPKGLGLGAERAPKEAAGKLLIPPAKDEVLAMRNGAFVKVLTGRQKDAYGTVESLNEDTGRVMVKFAIGGNRDYVNEYLLQLVSKAEYDQYAKVLNKEKYEQYKNKTTTSDHRLQEQKEESPPSREDHRQQSNRSTYRDREDREDRREREDRTDREDREYRTNRDDREDDREDRKDRDSRRDDREDRHRSSRRDDQRYSRDSEDSSEDEARHRSHHHKPSRTSSGTKKKSHKYKQHRRDYSRERDSRDYRDYRRGSSEEDEDRSRSKHAQEHKQKKTKKSKRQRSRSR